MIFYNSKQSHYLYSNMEELIKKIQEQLDNNWPVESDDIQALIDYIEAGE